MTRTRDTNDPLELPTILHQMSILRPDPYEDKKSHSYFLYIHQINRLAALGKKYGLRNWQLFEMLLQAFEYTAEKDAQLRADITKASETRISEN